MVDTDLIKMPLRILLLEDNPTDAEFVPAVLEADGLACEITRAETRAEFEAALAQGAFDLIISDFALPSFDGLTALALVRERRPDMPFILVSGTLGEEQAVESLKSGATDYVLKGRLERLGAAVRRAVREARERVRRCQTEEALRALRQSQEHFRRVIEDIFKFVPEALLVYTRSLNLYKHNKAFEDLVRTYAPKLNYTEPELREMLLQEIRAKVLQGDCGEIRIPPKSRDEKETCAPDHSLKPTASEPKNE